MPLTSHGLLLSGGAGLFLGSSVRAGGGYGPGASVTVSPPTSHPAGCLLFVATQNSVPVGEQATATFTARYPDTVPGTLTDHTLGRSRTADGTSNDNFRMQNNSGSTAEGLGYAYMVAVASVGSTITLAAGPNGARVVGSSATSVTGSATAPAAGFDFILTIADTSGTAVSIVTPAGFQLLDSVAFATTARAALFMRAVSSGATGTTNIQANGTSIVTVLSHRYVVTP